MAGPVGSMSVGLPGPRKANTDSARRSPGKPLMDAGSIPAGSTPLYEKAPPQVRACVRGCRVETSRNPLMSGSGWSCFWVGIKCAAQRHDRQYLRHPDGGLVRGAVSRPSEVRGKYAVKFSRIRLLRNSRYAWRSEGAGACPKARLSAPIWSAVVRSSLGSLARCSCRWM